MKKQYVTLRLCVTMFDKDDVVTASIAFNTQTYGVGVNATETWWSEN